MSNNPGGQSLLYFADPMCSWCWGFSPIVQVLRDQYKDVLPMQLFMGGLNPGNTMLLDADSSREIKRHWHHVHEESGQDFNFSFFEKQEFIYDTEPSSRAVIACLRIDSGRGLEFFNHLQRAFYIENRDVTDDAVLLELAVDFGFDSDQFQSVLNDLETSRITRLSFEYTRYLNITGFPTLIVQNLESNTHHVITRGYQPLRDIERYIEQWIERYS